MNELDRRLDRKLRAIAEGRYTPDDFVIADAKDADMGFGLTAAGPVDGAPDGVLGPGRYQTRERYLEDMRAQADHGVIDILLTSASNGERLAIGRLPAGGRHPGHPRQRHQRCVGRARRRIRGHAVAPVPDRGPGGDPAVLRPGPVLDHLQQRPPGGPGLAGGLCRVPPRGRVDRDAALPGGVQSQRAAVAWSRSRWPPFVNDSIVRALAGVTQAQRPVFLKLGYNGADALLELTEHDPSLVVGVYGGAVGTTRDTFELLHRAHEHGARVALFGRKIQHAESQLDLVDLLRPVLRGELSSADAVRAYHEALARADVRPRRSLDEDLELTDRVLRSE